MRAWQLHDTTGPDAYALDDVPEPEPGLGEVRVAPRISAINHLDLWVSRGLPAPPSLPFVTGADAAGVVDAVGEGVTAHAVGDEVVVNPSISCGHCRACLAGDNTDRIRSEAAFAKMCGVCPIPTGSGKTSGRHRLNRGGNRQANAALYRVVIVRMRWHPPTIAYVQRRTAQGLSKKDIIRCLKRYVAREIYHLLPEPASLDTEADKLPDAA